MEQTATLAIRSIGTVETTMEQTTIELEIEIRDLEKVETTYYRYGGG